MDDPRVDPSPYTEDTQELHVEERKRWLFFALPFSFTVYYLTNKKLTVRTGLFTTLEDDILLYRIMDTSYRRTIWQKIFGLGSIRIASSDHSMPELVIQNIRNAREFKDLLDSQIEKERLRLRFRAGEYADIGGDCEHDIEPLP